MPPKELDCTLANTREHIKNFCYKKKSVDTLLASNRTCDENTACYIALYPLEFLLKIASCLVDNKYPQIHFSVKLSNFYTQVCTSKGLQLTIDLPKLQSLKLTAKDIHMRYDPSVLCSTFGYTTTGELQQELTIIENELKKLQLQYFSQIGGVSIC